MITLETLKEFTALTHYKRDINNVLLVDGHAIATDGHIAVIVKLEFEHTELHTQMTDAVTDATRKFIRDFENNEYLQGTEVHEIIPVEPLPKNECPACHGTGWEEECPECDGDGEVQWESDNGYVYTADCRHECCNGGKIDRIRLKKAIEDGVECPLPEDCPVCKNPKHYFPNRDLGIQRFNGGLLDKITSKLGNVTLYVKNVSGKELAPAYFTFDGGFGIIMPMRKD